jgi:signal transduction histidine kinase
LRNPLAAIIGGAQFILENPGAEEQVRTLAERIVLAGERMQRLLVDLLDFTRTRISGQMPIERHSTDLAKPLQALADEFTTSHPKRTLNVDVTGDLHGNWDEQRISQAVGNLLGNAEQHGAPDGAIDLSTRTDDREIAISVHNEGPTIPSERHEQIFEPLTLVAKRRRTESRGQGRLGLGLYIAKAIVTGHGGRIEVDSSEGAGTTFTIHLPR